PAHRGGERVGNDVVGQFAEHGLVVVVAHLPGQPDRVGPAGDRQVGGQVADLVVLHDVVLLLLPEHAGDQPQAVVAGRDDAQLMAGIAVVITVADVLGWVDQRAAVVVDVGTVGKQGVVPERVVVVVGLLFLVALEVRVVVGEVEVPDLALHGQRALPPAVV